MFFSNARSLTGDSQHMSTRHAPLLLALFALAVACHNVQELPLEPLGEPPRFESFSKLTSKIEVCNTNGLPLVFDRWSRATPVLVYTERERMLTIKVHGAPGLDTALYVSKSLGQTSGPLEFVARGGGTGLQLSTQLRLPYKFTNYLLVVVAVGDAVGTAKLAIEADGCNSPCETSADCPPPSHPCNVSVCLSKGSCLEKASGKCLCTSGGKSFARGKTIANPDCRQMCLCDGPDSCAPVPVVGCAQPCVSKKACVVEQCHCKGATCGCQGTPGPACDLNCLESCDDGNGCTINGCKEGACLAVESPDGTVCMKGRGLCEGGTCKLLEKTCK